jgi:Tol biopolymer transport system component
MKWDTPNPIQDLAPLLGLGRLQWLEVLGVPLSQEAEQHQITALRQRGVEIAASPPATEIHGQRPDNQSRIAFISKRGVPDSDQGYRLYTIHPDGSDLEKINDLLFIGVPRFSAQQDKIAFGCDPDFSGPEVCDICVSGIDGSDLRNLTWDRSVKLLQNRPGAYWAPFWSPTGDKVGFSAAGHGLLSVSVDGANVQLFFQNTDLNSMYLVAVSHMWDKIAFLSGDSARKGCKFSLTQRAAKKWGSTPSCVGIFGSSSYHTRKMEAPDGMYCVLA